MAFIQKAIERQDKASAYQMTHPAPFSDDSCANDSKDDCRNCTKKFPSYIRCCALCETTEDRCKRQIVPGKYHCSQHSKSCAIPIEKMVPNWFWDEIMRKDDATREPDELLWENQDLLDEHTNGKSSVQDLIEQFEGEHEERVFLARDCYRGDCQDEGHRLATENLLVWITVLKQYKDLFH